MRRWEHRSPSPASTPAALRNPQRHNNTNNNNTNNNNNNTNNNGFFGQIGVERKMSCALQL
jgi:hypothetical protein